MRLNGAKLNQSQFARLIKAMALTSSASATKQVEVVRVKRKAFWDLTVGPHAFELAAASPLSSTKPIVFHDTEHLGVTYRCSDRITGCIHYANREAFRIAQAVDAEFCTFCREPDKLGTSFAGQTVCRKCLGSSNKSIRMAIAALQRK